MKPSKDAIFLENLQQKERTSLRASIREAECIGCTKCIQACPVDAIMGSAKSMHTVITAECTGCELCIAPCPVDCIDMLPISSVYSSPEQVMLRRQRFYAKKAREVKVKKTTQAPLCQR